MRTLAHLLTCAIAGTLLLACSGCYPQITSLTPLEHENVQMEMKGGAPFRCSLTSMDHVYLYFRSVDREWSAADTLVEKSDDQGETWHGPLYEFTPRFAKAPSGVLKALPNSVTYRVSKMQIGAIRDAFGGDITAQYRDDAATDLARYTRRIAEIQTTYYNVWVITSIVTVAAYIYLALRISR